MARLIVALALVAAVAAQQVCLPVQWEGYEFNYDIEKQFRGGFNISYDSTNQRVRVYAKEAVGDRQGAFETIALFASKTLYEIDHTKNVCHKTALNQPFQPECLPANHTLETAATIGISLNVNVYGFIIQNGADVAHGQLVLTASGNAPVEEVTFDRRAGVDHSSFWDVTTGIKNPAVFTPPSICANAGPRVISTVANKARARISGIIRA
eukprot:TRINITY_DN23186_c0_g1_i1.p1 TRINITY_DN23186_c0_g1~~TRINITY_DN23186_c0_g1_i1.p1  ORF type:complete len:230 (+),score=85.01 TRINITY_DN23186_c0_g1_i1:63-692(+)